VPELPVIKIFGGATSGSKFFFGATSGSKKKFGATSAYKNFMAQLPEL
jgi:hypothetical protein